MSFSDGQFLELLASAYRDAVLDGVDMHATTDALELIRGAGPSSMTYLDTWDAVDHQIGVSPSTAVQGVLSRFRDKFVKQATAAEVARLQGELEADSERGWEVWLGTFADGLERWRWTILEALVDMELSVPDELPQRVEDLRRWTMLGKQDRWAEILGLFEFLGDQEFLTAERRASMLVSSAEVHMYDLLDREGAESMLERARELAPGTSRVLVGTVELDLQQGDYERARSGAEALLRQQPSAPDGYNLIGTSHEKEEDLEAAERWYLEAVRAGPGYESGYLNLLRLYGRPELFATHEPRLEPLRDRLAAVEPNSNYSSMVEMGQIYQANDRFDEANAWFQRASILEPSWPNAYVNAGYSQLDASDYEGAEAAFNRAVHVAPEYFEAHWGLAWLYETTEQWANALDAYTDALALRPSWRDATLARIGDIRVRNNEFESAERELLEALTLDPMSLSVLDSLHDLADACYSVEGRIDDTKRILRAVRSIRGDEYEATYENRLGNVYYYDGDYEAAIHAYEKAIEVEPHDPVYFGNLGNAWANWRIPGRRSQELANAIAALEQAAELAPEDPDYEERLTGLRSEHSVVIAFGEAVLNFEWVLPPIRVDVSDDVAGLILKAGGTELSTEVLALIEDMRERLRRDYGVAVPGIRFWELESEGGERPTYVIRLHGVALSRERIYADRRFIPGSLDTPIGAGLPSEVLPQALAGAWIEQPQWGLAEEAGLVQWTPVHYMLNHIEGVLRAHLDEFVDADQAMMLVPTELIRQVAEPVDRLSAFVRVLRCLVREGVPIAPIEPILGEFLVLVEDGYGVQSTVERLRALPGVLSRLPGNDNDSSFVALGSHIESELRASVNDGDAEPVLALRPVLRKEVINAIRREVRTKSRPVLVVQDSTLRPLVRQLVETTLPDLPVLSRAELPDDLALGQEGMAEVTWAGT